MEMEFKEISINKDILNYGEKSNIITFDENLFDKSQLNALSNQYEKLGFLKCAYKYNDNYVDLCYHTTNLISIDQYFHQNNINETEFISIIKTICQSIKLCSNYIYINQNNLIINEELIYIHSKNKSINIMYVPVNTQVTDNVLYDLKKLIINLINNYLITDRENIFTQEIIEKIKCEEVNIDELLKLFDKIIENSNRDFNKKIKIKDNLESSDGVITIKEVDLYSHEDQEKHIKEERKEKKSLFKNLFSFFKNKSEVNNNLHIDLNHGSDDKLILKNDLMTIVYLIPENNYNEKIPIDKNVFIIGRRAEIVDYKIDNNTVGKVHAKFIRRGNKYYLVDLESKNGTYVNGTKLISNSLYEIKDNDSIVFSNAKYKFKVKV